MEVVNTSSVPVDVVIYAPPEGRRTAIFTGKATFSFTDAGRVSLELDHPVPLWAEDEETELGLLPRDSLPRCDPMFEVILLGRAHAPHGQPVEQMMVTLAVGEERRWLTVFGNRVWVGEEREAAISAAEPFVTMPLTWQRAFGGKQGVLVDQESPIDVIDPTNPDGKGFDHIGQARQTAELFRPPPPYPQFDPVRELPNLEDPHHPIERWEDAPLPACWAAARLDSAIVVERLRRAREARPDEPVTIGSPEFMHRAHPDWVIGLPPEGAPVEMDGLLPTGPVRFRLPSLRVVLDARIGDEESRLELVPRALVLLPEEHRFYIVYRQFMTYLYDEDESRAVRVRLEQGWAGA